MKEQDKELFEKLFDDLCSKGTIGWNDTFVYVLTKDDALELFTAAMKEREWISVDKELPKDPEDECLYVLVYLDTGMIFKGRHYTNGWSAFYADGERSVHPDIVTHWQPLPHPPKE